MSSDGQTEAPRKPALRGRTEIRDVFYALGLVTLIIAVIVLAADALTPIVLAFFVWFFVNAIANGMRALPGLGAILPSWLALSASAALVISAFFVFGQIVVANAAGLGAGLENLGPRAAAAIAAAEEAVGFEFGLDVEQYIADFAIGDVIGQIAGALTSTANTIILVLLYVLFLIFDQQFYGQKIRALFPDEVRSKNVRAVLARIGADTRLYVWIMTMVSMGVGLCTYALAAYFGLEAAIFWGFLAFALNYIPTIGSFLGVLFPGLYALVQFDAPETVLAFVAALGVVQFVAGNIIVPRLMGDQLNLSQFVIILSLTIWGSIWGVIGLFLAVPMMMVLAIVLSQFDSTRPVAILLSRTGNVAGR